MDGTIASTRRYVFAPEFSVGAVFGAEKIGLVTGKGAYEERICVAHFRVQLPILHRNLEKVHCIILCSILSLRCLI
jgi:hypothetical protein